MQHIEAPLNQSESPAQRPAIKYRLDPEKAARIRTTPPCVMTVQEASAYLACSPRKLRDLVATRLVRSARVGVKIVIRRDWLDAFLGS